MKIFGHIDKNNNVLKCIVAILMIIPIVFQLVLSSLPLFQRFIFILYSIVFLLLGFGGVYFVLGLQVIIKILSKKVLRIVCNFFIIIGVINLILQYLFNLSFINTGNEALAIAFIYTMLGAVIGSYRIKNKYTIE